MKKQQLKSLHTKNDLKAAAAELFAANGYADTSIQDIVRKSGYSIGAFYGHFASKQELATALWMDTMMNDIQETSHPELQFADQERFIEYLIEHAQMIRGNALIEAITPHCVFSPEIQHTISEHAKQYLGMLVQAIRYWNPSIDEETAINCASATQCLISSYSQGSLAPFIQITKDGLRMLVRKLMILE